MMLGKRQRPPMKKTTSMTEFTLDLSFTTAVGVPPQPAVRINRRNSVEYFTDDSAHFLKFCSLCNRRLIPGRDIFMYRGDSGFCSSECRQQQIIQDERKEKAAACVIATHTNNIESSSSSSAAASSISIAAGSEITEPISTAVI